MAHRSSTVFAPATIANLASGFDVLGLALEQPGDTVTCEYSSTPGVRIASIEGDGGRLPYESDRNCASVAIAAMLSKLGCAHGMTVRISKGMPLGSGLGSSAASSVAAVFAANIVCGSPFTREELVEFAAAGERIASGTAHADNVAPALLGGLVLIQSYTPLKVVRIKAPAELYTVVSRPHYELSTADARAVLGTQVVLNDVIAQTAALATLVLGFEREDYALISAGLVDRIAQPARSKLIPCYDQVVAAAIGAGALGVSISGSGPSVFALARGAQVAELVGQAFKKTYAAAELGCDVFVGKVNQSGAREL